MLVGKLRLKISVLSGLREKYGICSVGNHACFESEDEIFLHQVKRDEGNKMPRQLAELEVEHIL